LRDSERTAKSIVESVLPGTVLEYQSAQSAGEHDFDLRKADGTIAPLEVTVSTVQALEAASAVLRNEKRGGRFIPQTKSSKDWLVEPLVTANLKKVRDKVDEYLAAVESEGLQRFFSPMDAGTSPAVMRLYRELGIEGGTVVRWKPPGRIGINTPSAEGGLVTPKSVLDAVAVECLKPDNRRKLGAAGAAERHLFVMVSPTHFLPWVAMVDEVLPADPPLLPPEITHVWAAAPARKAGEYVVWLGTAAGWRDVGPVAIAVSDGAVQR
jgi:hypothetical protein